MIVRASGITLLDMSTNALAMDYERESRRHIMGPLHSGFSGGTLLGAAVVWAVLLIGGGYRTVYAGMTVLMLGLMAWAFYLSRTPIPSTPVTGSVKASAALGLLKQSEIRWLGLITAFTMGGEILISQWAAIYLREERDLSARVGVYAVAAYGLAMFSGRVTNGPVAAKLGIRPAIALQGAMAMIGGALIVTGGPASLAVIGCGIAGYGLAGTIPIAMSLVGKIVPHGTAAASGATLALGYTGFAITPIVAGVFADLVSARAVMCGVILAGSLILIMIARYPEALRRSAGAGL
jgi:fucose permease